MSSLEPDLYIGQVEPTKLQWGGYLPTNFMQASKPKDTCVTCLCLLLTFVSLQVLLKDLFALTIPHYELHSHNILTFVSLQVLLKDLFALTIPHYELHSHNILTFVSLQVLLKDF